MEHVVDAVDRDRRRFPHKVEDPLDPEKMLAMPAAKPGEPLRQRAPFERHVEGEAKGAHAGIVNAVAVMVLVRAGSAVISRLVDPCPHVRRLARRVEQAGSEELLGVDLAVQNCVQAGSEVEAAEALAQPHDLRSIREIGLGEEQPVGDRRLLGWLGLFVELRRSVHRVDGRRDRVKPHEAVEHRVVEQELHDRGRVREPGRLDQHAAEGRDLASVAAGEETAQGLGKVAAHRAADAAARHHGDLARDRLDEVVMRGTSPNSLMITALSPMPGWRRSRFNSVVLPEPR